MPATHTETFRVRYYECDAYGYLTIANCVRWMQESAFAASAAVGYDFRLYDQMGNLWLIRETDVEYVTPLKYGDEVEIKTWVMDFRRFRSLRAYEIRHTHTGKLAARGATDWVYLHSETLQPVSIPKEMQHAFFPEGAPDVSVPRQHYPKPPAPPANAFMLRKRVEWSDIDMMWHVNNARYLEFTDEAEKQACAKYGWPIQRMKAAGFGIYPRQYHIEYRQPAELGDELEIATWCSDVKDETALRHYEIRRLPDRELLVQAQTRWGCMHLLTEKAISIPEDFLQSLADNQDLDQETLRVSENP